MEHFLCLETRAHFWNACTENNGTIALGGKTTTTMQHHTCSGLEAVVCLQEAIYSLIALVATDHDHIVDKRRRRIAARLDELVAGNRMRHAEQQEQQSMESVSRTKTDNCCGPQIKQKDCPAIGTVPTVPPRIDTARPPEKQTEMNDDVW